MANQVAKKHKTKQLPQDRVFDAVILIVTVLIWIIIFYPLYFVVIASFSNPAAVSSGKLLLLPEKITFAGYKNIFENGNIWHSYRNTIFYVLFGTITSVVVTVMAAYSLSRKDLPGRNIFMLIFVFTMYFSGGLIPQYLVVKNMGLVNNPLIIILLGAFSVYNMIIARTYFVTSIPLELQEAAFIDGCNNQTLFFKIVLPLSKPIIAVLALYFAVGQWNAYFNALIYLNESKYYPLQLVLRSILLSASAFNNQTQAVGTDTGADFAMQQLSTVIRYGTIVVSTLPIIAVYPFLQKYFVQGVMIGAIKG